MYTADGWLEDQEQQFFYNRIHALKKCWYKNVSVAGETVKNDKKYGQKHFGSI